MIPYKDENPTLSTPVVTFVLIAANVAASATMNIQMPITYLTGGDDFFGPNLGGATVATSSTPRSSTPS